MINTYVKRHMYPCIYCNELYISETERGVGDRFQEHLRHVKRNDKDASKPVSRHLNHPNHSKQRMAVCSLFFYLPNRHS